MSAKLDTTRPDRFELCCPGCGITAVTGFTPDGPRELLYTCRCGCRCRLTRESATDVLFEWEPSDY